MKDFEMLLIPDPHRFYAVTGKKIYPVRSLKPEESFTPLTPADKLYLSELSSQDSLDKRLVVEDSGARYMLPKSFPPIAMTEVISIEIGHQVMPFSYPLRCVGDAYVSTFSEDRLC